MNCDTARRLMHLRGVDERSPDEQQALGRHLRHCAACAEEYRGIPATDARLRQLIGEAPRPARPGELRDAILQRIGDVDRNLVVQSSSGHVLDSMAARFAAAAAVVLLLSSLLFHLYELHAAVAHFEQRLALRGDERQAAEVVYAVRSDDVTGITGMAADSGLSRKSGFHINGTLRFSRSELQRLLGTLAFMPDAVRARAPDRAGLGELLDELTRKLYLTIRTGDEGGRS
jgi:anti-sigma factor RsiW